MTIEGPLFKSQKSLLSGIILKSTGIFIAMGQLWTGCTLFVVQTVFSYEAGHNKGASGKLDTHTRLDSK